MVLLLASSLCFTSPAPGITKPGCGRHRTAPSKRSGWRSAPIPIDPTERADAEDAARKLLRELIGSDYSDTTLRVCADHLLSFRRHPKTQAEQPPTAALHRLLVIAKSDAGQSTRIANNPRRTDRFDP